MAKLSQTRENMAKIWNLRRQITQIAIDSTQVETPTDKFEKHLEKITYTQDLGVVANKQKQETAETPSNKPNKQAQEN